MRVALIALLERLYIPCPAGLVAPVNRLIARPESRADLAAAAGAVARWLPSSVVATYLSALTLSLLDRFEEAHGVARRAIARQAKHTPMATRSAAVMRRIAPRKLRQAAALFEFLGQRRASHFEDIWRTVDEVARDKMRWSAEEASEGGPAEVETVAESLLQNRRESEYLEACWQRFRAAKSLHGRLRAITAMIRRGVRKMPDYHEPYAQARAAFASLDSEWRPLTLSGAATAASGWQLSLLHRLAQRLGRADDAAAILEAMAVAAEKPGSGSLAWFAAARLAETGAPADLERAGRIASLAGRVPTGVLEVRSYFIWALHAREFAAAERLFEGLGARMRWSLAAQSYITILQAQSKFAEAAELSSAMAGGFLAFPWYLTPHQHWRYLLRAGDLRFAADAARHLSAVPQPRNPKGVVFVAPRSLWFMRKLPLVVLIELKRQGFAVVPLVEGSMPQQATGDPALDAFAGALRADGRLAPGAAAAFRPPARFEADAAAGKLMWNGLDLSHALHEEAAISRRRYSVDMTCPALVESFDRLVAWTRSMAGVVENAHDLLARPDFRVCFLTLYQSRLPDALIRKYCAEKGDAGRFFCAHATNGYENYFANFTSAYATKCAIRNMTATPETRTASFPSPARFEGWYGARPAGSGPVARPRHLNGHAYPPEAVLAVKRINAWRAKGGKVVCAFGKVVCDIAMPSPGGPAHADIKDWINHTVAAVAGSSTLLLVKPHPHEINNEIGTFLTEHFEDLIAKPLPANVMMLGHDWFTVETLASHIDLAVIFNGTSAVELGVKGIPAVLCSDFAAADYPVGHAVPRDRAHYERLMRFEEPVAVSSDLAARSRYWLDYMQSNRVSVPYRYHAREITNKVVHMPWWFEEDIAAYFAKGDPSVTWLARQITGAPGDQM